MLIALSGSHKAGIAAAAAVFVVFALASAMIVPRLRADFPGAWLRLFVLVAVALTVGMLATIVVLASESESEEAGGETAVTETEAPPTTPPTTPSQGGSVEAGKAVFAKAGCGGCHTLKAAGASGTVGPNLDEAKPATALVVDRVTNGKGVMPSFKGRLSEAEIEDVAAYVAASAAG